MRTRKREREREEWERFGHSNNSQEEMCKMREGRLLFILGSQELTLLDALQVSFNQDSLSISRGAHF
jgi:hypothetical protein